MVFNAFTSFLNRSLNALVHSARMTAIPHAALALTSALGRFEFAGSRLLEAATGAGDAAEAALVDLIEAEAQAKAGVALVRFADDVYRALLDIGRER
jgi:hypothetical protein